MHVFCHAVPGTWHAMGVMLSRRRARCVAARTRSAPTTRRSTTRRPRWAPGAEGLLFAPYLAGRAHAACRPGRARRVHRALAAPRPRRARRAPCSRASPTGCATRSSCCARSASSPTVGRVSGGGARSDLWLRIVASVLGLPLERTESEEGAAFGAALLAGVRAGVFADAEEAVARCVRVRDRIEPDPAGPRPTRRATRASGSLSRLRPLEEQDDSRRQDGGDHRREPRHRRRGRAACSTTRGVNLGLASRRGDDLGLDRTVAQPCDVRDLEALERLCQATAERSAGSTSSSRTPASARTGHSSTCRGSTSTR